MQTEVIDEILLADVHVIRHLPDRDVVFHVLLKVVQKVFHLFTGLVPYFLPERNLRSEKVGEAVKEIQKHGVQLQGGESQDVIIGQERLAEPVGERGDLLTAVDSGGVVCLQDIRVIAGVDGKEGDQKPAAGRLAAGAVGIAGVEEDHVAGSHRMLPAIDLDFQGALVDVPEGVVRLLFALLPFFFMADIAAELDIQRKLLYGDIHCSCHLFSSALFLAKPWKISSNQS